MIKSVQVFCFILLNSKRKLKLNALQRTAFQWKLQISQKVFATQNRFIDYEYHT